VVCVQGAAALPVVPRLPDDPIERFRHRAYERHPPVRPCQCAVGGAEQLKAGDIRSRHFFQVQVKMTSGFLRLHHGTEQFAGGLYGQVPFQLQHQAIPRLFYGLKFHVRPLKKFGVCLGLLEC
jgi:hypothetical protein